MRLRPSVELRPAHDNFFEQPPAMLIVLKLIEARASRSKQNNVPATADSLARRTAFSRVPACSISGRALNLRLDLRRRRTNRVHPFHPLPQQIVKHAVIAAFILAAENQSECLQGTIPAP